MRTLLRSRTGTTLIELLFFVAIMGIVIAVALPMLFSATENRLLQQTISIVEQNGTQVLQTTTQQIRLAERILSPAVGATGSVLVMQTGSGATDPILIGYSSGTIVLIQHTIRETITSPQVAVLDFEVRNTSTSATRQSAEISFRLSRTIRLQQPHSYVQNFQGAAALLPDDVPSGGSAFCIVPACLGDNIFRWSVWENGSCYTATSQLQCP